MEWLKCDKDKKNKWEWHKYFAWFPVTVKKGYNGDEIRIWLQLIERKQKSDYHDDYYWDYRKIKK